MFQFASACEPMPGRVPDGLVENAVAGDNRLCLPVPEEGGEFALDCGYQKLAARVGCAGLRIASTDDQEGELSVVAVSVNGRGVAPSGNVERASGVVRFLRPGVTEEYSAGINGVRQDFLLTEEPAARGPVGLSLRVTGAAARMAACGAELELQGSGRVLAYSRLKVTDATGIEIAAAMETPDTNSITIRFDDTAAVYPVRVDPTFSDADWVVMNAETNGADGLVRCIAQDAAGNLYAGGDFKLIQNVAANGLAKWNGSAWSAMGLQDGSSVSAILSDGSNIHVGGLLFFPGASGYCVGSWNGAAWSKLGSGMSGGSVNALAKIGSDIYAGGGFTSAGGVSANRIAKWNGSAWSALGSGMDASVQALAVMGGDLFAGGYFSTAGGSTAGGVAKWNGSAWSAVGTGTGSFVNQWVNALATDGSNLYAGGNFFNLGSATVTRIAKWDGGTWTGLGTGVNGEVRSILINGADVYVAGGFTKAGSPTAWGVAKWNGAAWSALGAGLSNNSFASSATGYALGMKDGVLHVGGSFGGAGSVVATNFAKWSGTAWSSQGIGINGAIRAVVVSGTDIYVGGKFTSIGNTAATLIAKWNGSSWSALRAAAGQFGEGFPLGTEVSAIAVSGGDVYVGGMFTYAGGPILGNHIAKWNGSTWTALGTGVSGMDAGYMGTAVRAIMISGDNVYVGGTFTNAGGNPAYHIERWNTTTGTWSALGAGYAAYVNSMAVIDSDLYVGGSPVTVTGFSQISKWDGAAWTNLAPVGNVFSLVSSGGDLYAGGNFAIGGVQKRIAKWNGSAWSDLGSGIGSSVSGVNALVVSGTNLYAGGNFALAGGGSASNIAMWDGAAWSPLGSGTNGVVSAMAMAGTDLFVGGEFVNAGAKFTPYLAKAGLGGGGSAFSNWQQGAFGSNAGNPAIAGPLADPDGDGVPNLVEYAMNLTPSQNLRGTLDPANGTGGLPFIRTVAAPGGTVLRITYLRRKAATNPGVTYTPQFSGSLDPWTNASGAESVQSVDATWERVTVDDTVVNAPQRFGRVVVTQAP